MKKLDIKNIHKWPVPMKGIVVALCCAVVFYFGYSIDLSNIQKQLQANQQQEGDFKTQLDATLLEYAELEQAISQLGDIEKALATWQKKLILQQDLPDLLNQILKLGTSSGLQFNLFNPGADVSAEGYLKVPIKVVVVGNYNQIASFISKVANMTSIVAISDFSISRMPKSTSTTPEAADQSASSNQLTAQIILEVYHLGSK